MEPRGTAMVTPEQREQLKGELARKRTVVLMVLGSAVALAVAAFVVDSLTGSLFGLSRSVWIPVAIVYLAAEFTVAAQLWRCPSCKRRLPFDLDPTSCGSCGALFK